MSDGDREILADFIRMREKTLELLATIPDEWLARRADGEQYALGHLFAHIARSIAWWMNRVMTDGGPYEKSEALPDREAIVLALRQTQHRLINFFNQDGAMNRSYPYPHYPGDANTRPLTGRWCVLYLIQHEVHHRGKIVLALRQWGMTRIPFLPYSGWD